MKYISTITKQNIPTFHNLFSKAAYKDDFGYSSGWNHEIEKWLLFIKHRNPAFFNRNENRIKREKQRDELLGEYKAAYFFEKKLGYQILELEPLNGRLDLLVKDGRGIEWFVEVKTPSWRNEVVEEINSRQLDRKTRINLIKDRLNKPQHISGDGRSVSIENAIKDPVRKSVEKFPQSKNNMLVITPNMFADTTGFAGLFGGDQVREVVKKFDDSKLITRVLILETILPLGGNVEYRHVFIEI